MVLACKQYRRHWKQVGIVKWNRNGLTGNGSMSQKYFNINKCKPQLNLLQ
jgi:hypothetical protein